jgi:hypothetical protein
MSKDGVTATQVGGTLMSLANAAAPLAVFFPVGTIAVGLVAIAGCIFSLVGKKRTNKTAKNLQAQKNEIDKKNGELEVVNAMTNSMNSSFSNIMNSFKSNNKNQFDAYA